MRRLCFVSASLQLSIDISLHPSIYLYSYPSMYLYSHPSLRPSIHPVRRPKRSRSRVGPVARAVSSPLLAARTAVSAGRGGGAGVCVCAFVCLLACADLEDDVPGRDFLQRAAARVAERQRRRHVPARTRRKCPSMRCRVAQMSHGAMSSACCVRARSVASLNGDGAACLRALFLGRERAAACARASPYAPAGDTSEEDEGGKDGAGAGEGHLGRKSQR
jgi:hypothetical protein